MAAMPEITHEFQWLPEDRPLLYKVGVGQIATPHEQILFTVKRPFEPVSDHPIEVFPGFTDGIEGTDRLTNAYAVAGRVAITLGYPRIMHPDFLDDPEGHKVNTGMLVLGAARALMPDLQKVDAKGHSEGGANASRACLEHPGEFRSLVVMGSGGLIKNDNARRILGRALRNPGVFTRLTWEMASHPAYGLGIVRASSNYVWQNPGKARQEAVRIASADITGRPARLRELGIPSGALQFGGDELFPLKLVEQGTDGGRIFDLFQVYPDRGAGHLTPQMHPHKVAKLALKMTSELVQIQQRRDSAKSAA
ncbi:MAG: alpha/beta hydrolase [Candidatus Saccharimonadales bacterium]